MTNEEIVNMHLVPVDGRIMITLSKELSWFRLTPDEAIELGNNLLKVAEAIKQQAVPEKLAS